MTPELRLRLLRDALQRAQPLTADEQNAAITLGDDVAGLSYASADVEALIDAAEAVVTAFGTAEALEDLTEMIGALDTAAGITPTAGGA